MLHAKGALGFVLPSVEWWNEHVDWFVYTALWAPHALSSLLAGLTGFLLLWKAPERASWGRMLCYRLLAGAALATCVGAPSTFLSCSRRFLVVWTGITFWKGWRRETAGLVVAGGVCHRTGSAVPSGTAGSGRRRDFGRFPHRVYGAAFSFAALIPSWPA